MICSSVNRFFTSNLRLVGDWTPNRRATQNRGDVGDTWHESLDAAFMQAEHEYGLSASDFLAVHEGQPDSSRDGAA
jgi:hypothetical protein